MNSNDFAEALAPFGLLANRNALSPVYRSIFLAPGLITGASQFGVLEAAIDALEIKDAEGAAATATVSAASLIAISKSLPPDEELALVVKSGALHWECGLAAGRIALAGSEVVLPSVASVTQEFHMPNIPAEPLPARMRNELADVLLLGALSCGAASLASAGLFGVVIDNRETCSIYASDSVTLSRCLWRDSVPGFPDITVLSPEAVKVLCAILNHPAAGERADLRIVENKLVLYRGGPFSLALRPIPPLKQDLRDLFQTYSEAADVVSLPQASIATFIKRATALAEAKGAAHVTLEVADGALSLSFEDATAAAEEYYLVDGMDSASAGLPAISLDAIRLARALAHSDSIVLDHLERGVLVLSGKAPPFSYVISGRR